MAVRNSNWVRVRGAGAVSAVMGLLLLAGGCQLAGKFGSPSASPGASTSKPSGFGPTGVYQGALDMEGGELTAALQIIRHGSRDIRGLMQTSSGLEAEGEGELHGREFRLELVYGGDCPGRMVLVGEWDPDTDSLAGIVQATDCTGAAEGTFLLSADKPTPALLTALENFV